MFKTKLIKWGNSAGLRIPTQALHKSHAYLGEEFEVIPDEQGGFYLKPLRSLEATWLEAFNKVADSQNDNLDIDDLPNQFDEDDWTW
jgi:antitoxin component of MazEF toxin-antitoxin module